MIGETIGLKKLVDSVDFTETLEELAALRWEVLGKKDNSLLGLIHLSSVSLSKSRQAIGGTAITDLYKPNTGSAILSRGFAWQRGVVGLRWILGEQTIKQLRKDQSDSMLRLLSDKDAASMLVLNMEKEQLPKYLRGKDIFFLNIRPAAAYRAVAFATSMELGRLETLFSEEEIVAFYKTGVTPDSVYKKAHALAERIKDKGRLEGTVAETGERVRFDKNIPSMVKHRKPLTDKEIQRQMLYEEMNQSIKDKGRIKVAGNVRR